MNRFFLCGQNTLSIFIKIKDGLFSEQPTFSPMLVIRDVGNLVKKIIEIDGCETTLDLCWIIMDNICFSSHMLD